MKKRIFFIKLLHLRIDVIEEPGGNRIRRMKIKAQQKIRKTGIFVSKGLFRSNVSLLKARRTREKIADICHVWDFWLREADSSPFAAVAWIWLSRINQLANKNWIQFFVWETWELGYILIKRDEWSSSPVLRKRFWAPDGDRTRNLLITGETL